MSTSNKVYMKSFKLGESKPLTLEEAKKAKKIKKEDEKEFEEQIELLKDKNKSFSDIMVVVFGWKKQKSGERKLVSRLPNGKILFPDWQENQEEIVPGIPYICLVFERDKVAFSKVASEYTQPTIFVPENRMVAYIIRKEDGSFIRDVIKEGEFSDKLEKAITSIEDLGYSNVKLILRKNEGK